MVGDNDHFDLWVGEYFDNVEPYVYNFFESASFKSMALLKLNVLKLLFKYSDTT